MQRKSIGVQIAQAIAFLHSNIPKIVHLDVKPANVLVSICHAIAVGSNLCFLIQVEANNYHIYLADFGVSKVLHKTIATIKTNLSAGSIGTPGYQSIEQLVAGIITESVDVYALGCVLIELFGGQRVWEGLSAVQIVVKVVSEKRVPDTTHLPPAIQELVAKCLQQKTERATAMQVLNRLLKLPPPSL